MNRFFNYNLIAMLGLLLALSSCSKLDSFNKTKLLFTVENRNIEKDEIIEYRFFENAFVNITITQNSNQTEKLYDSRFKKLSASQLAQSLYFQNQLQRLDYNNSLPWKENYYKRGNVVRFIFAAKQKLSLKNEEKKELLIPKVFYYYQGLDDMPELFRKIVKFTEEI